MISPIYKAVVIGASAGAMDALTTMLPALPVNYALPVMIVVHLPPDKKSIIADLLRAHCKVSVREAEDKEPILPGTVYFAPPDYHLLVEKNESLSLSSEEAILYSRPAVDVLFETAADVYGDTLIGIILTGGSSDGANGLKTICDAGGTTLIQDPDTAYAYYMPQSAFKACPTAQVLSLDEITQFLCKAHTS